MKGKAGLVVGMAAGYVLGTHDGRGRYEQIKTQAEKLWNDPRVQQKATQAQDLAKQKAPQVQEKVSQVADKAAGKVGAKSASSTSGNGRVEPSTGTQGPTTTTSGAPSAPKSVTPATVPVAKGPELHADTTPPATPGGLDG